MLRLLTLPTGMKQSLRLPHACITTLTLGLRFTVCHNYLFELTKCCDYIYQRMIYFKGWVFTIHGSSNVCGSRFQELKKGIFVGDHVVSAYKQTVAFHPHLFKQAGNLYAFWPRLPGGWKILTHPYAIWLQRSWYAHSRLLIAFKCQSSNRQRFCKCITSHYATQRQTGCLTPSGRALHRGTARVASIFGAFHFMGCCKTSSDNLMVPSK